MVYLLVKVILERSCHGSTSLGECAKRHTIPNPCGETAEERGFQKAQVYFQRRGRLDSPRRPLAALLQLVMYGKKPHY